MAHYMKKPFCVLLSLAVGTGLTVRAQTQKPVPVSSLPAGMGPLALLAPGDSASRQFGDLILCYKLLRPPQAVRCTLYLVTQLVGVRQLSVDSPLYTFDLRLGLGQAHGSLTLQPVSAQQGQIATLAGNFTYSVPQASTQSPFVLFLFQGDLFGWYARP